MALARIPPWRRWVRGRENIPNVAFNRSLSLQDATPVALMNSVGRTDNDSLIDPGSALTHSESSVIAQPPHRQERPMISERIGSLRKLLAKKAPLASQAVAELDSLCDSISNSLSTMQTGEKIQMICALGQVKDFTVTNRVADRYNNKSLSYENKVFFTALTNSIEWKSLFVDHFSKFRSLAPLLHVLRAVNRMDLGKEKTGSILSDVFDSITRSSQVPGNPKQVTELVMMSAKNRLVHESFFNMVISDMVSNHHSYSEDLIGDVVRSLTTLKFHSNELRNFLADQVPLVSHELNWWNLIDIADYYSQVVPRPFSDADLEVTTRLANECWKWIPDMRCGYAAKGLRVLSSLEVGDKRTIRSLIRHIPRALGKLHNNAVAESIVSAVRSGYNPRMKYGKRYGSVLYRRLSAKLTLTEDSLATVSSDLIVSVVQALVAINRPQSELFDQIVDDLSKRPSKYTPDQVLTLDRLWGGSRLNFVHESVENVSVSNLAHLVKMDSEQWLPVLLALDPIEFNRLSVSDLTGLLHHEAIHSMVERCWVQSNLSTLTCSDLANLTQALAEAPLVLSAETVALVIDCGNQKNWNDYLDALVTFLTSLGIVSDNLPAYSRLFDFVTRQSTKSLSTIRRCQLIAAIMRTSPPQMGMDQSVGAFLAWIESHLVSRYIQPDSIQSQGYVPNGAVNDLNVFPVTIALAIPNPTMDLSKVHQARTSTAVRRLVPAGDAGVALLVGGNRRSIDEILTDRYLASLGWTVRYLDNRAQLVDPFAVTRALLGSRDELPL